MWANRISGVNTVLKSVTIHSNFGCFTLIDVVESHFDDVLDGLTLLGASLSLTTSAEHG